MPNTPPYRPSCSGSNWNPPYLSGCSYVSPATSGKFEPHPEGWPVYENTTVVEPVCPEGPTVPATARRCSVGETPETPEDCGDNCFLLNPYTPRYLNTYALKEPAEYAAVGVCRPRGFKVVYAMKAWHGRRGFTEPCDLKGLSQTKYLAISRSSSCTYDFNQEICVPGQYPQQTIERTGTRSGSVNRYTGQLVGATCTNFHYADGVLVDQDDQLITIEHCGASWGAGWICEGFDDLFENIDLAVVLNSDSWPGGINPYDDDDTDFVIDKGTASPTEIDVHIEIRTYSDCEGERTLAATIIYDITASLSSPYTAGDVDDDVEELLAFWNLADDAQYPWRTDVPQILDGAYAPNFGPSYGPLVTYRESGPASPDVNGCESAETLPTIIYGKPIQAYVGGSPGGYEPWFNSEHENMSYGDVGGTSCFRVTGWGASSPFPNATQWMPDYVNNAFPPGAIACYGSPRFTATDCSENTAPLFSGYLVKSKYAEVYLHEFPSHNYARPCGETDRQAVNWDYLNCAEGNPRNALEWPRDARWPNAATPTDDVPNSNKGSDVSCYCNQPQAEITATDPHSCLANDAPAAIEQIHAPTDTASGNTPTKADYGYNDVDRKGDFSVKQWHYTPIKRLAALELNPLSTTSELASMACTPGCVTKKPCRASAIFFQQDAPDGQYADATHFIPSGVGLREDDYSAWVGEATVMQLHQVMVDPLWQQPRLPCPDGSVDPEAEVPLEENRECADGLCDDYVAERDAGGAERATCEPSSMMPWQY